MRLAGELRFDIGQPHMIRSVDTPASNASSRQRQATGGTVRPHSAGQRQGYRNTPGHLAPAAGCQRIRLDQLQVGKPRKVKIRLSSQTLATPSPDMSAACVQSPKRQRRAISNKMITPKL